MDLAMMAQHTITNTKILRVVFLKILPLRLLLISRRRESVLFPVTFSSLLFRIFFYNIIKALSFAVNEGCHSADA
jgi:hypothetical protein